MADLNGLRRGTQKLRHLFNWTHRGGQSDLLNRPSGEPLQARDGKRQVRATLVVRDRVNLVHNERAHGLEHFPRALRRQQNEQRLGRRDQDMRSFLAHSLTFGGGRVAGTHSRADFP